MCLFFVGLLWGCNEYCVIIPYSQDKEQAEPWERIRVEERKMERKFRG